MTADPDAVEVPLLHPGRHLDSCAMSRREYSVPPELVVALQRARLLMLAEEEHQRAQAERRVIATGLASGLPEEDNRYRRIAKIALAWHAETERFVRVMRTAQPKNNERPASGGAEAGLS